VPVQLLSIRAYVSHGQAGRTHGNPDEAALEAIEIAPATAAVEAKVAARHSVGMLSRR
jgi:hypothetical protein